jgi:hypothetical protein
MKLNFIHLDIDSDWPMRYHIRYTSLKLTKLMKNDLRFGRNTDLYRLEECSTSTEVMDANFILAMSKEVRCA